MKVALLSRWLRRGLLIAAVLPVLLLSVGASGDDAATQPADRTFVGGTAKFGGSPCTWSATLTKTDKPGVYTADYVASFQNNKHMTYVGTITTDWKTTIKGDGKSTGGGGNGTFAWDAKFDEKGVANTNYKEVGGRGRNGAFVVDLSIKQP